MDFFFVVVTPKSCCIVPSKWNCFSWNKITSYASDTGQENRGPITANKHRSNHIPTPPPNPSSALFAYSNEQHLFNSALMWAVPSRGHYSQRCLYSLNSVGQLSPSSQAFGAMDAFVVVTRGATNLLVVFFLVVVFVFVFFIVFFAA